MFGIASSNLALSSQSLFGPAGGATDGYGLGQGAMDRAVVHHCLMRVDPATLEAAARGSSELPPNT